MMVVMMTAAPVGSNEIVFAYLPRFAVCGSFGTVMVMMVVVMVVVMVVTAASLGRDDIVCAYIRRFAVCGGFSAVMMMVVAAASLGYHQIIFADLRCFSP